MSNAYRVIDANINRVSEGLRVIEDYVRFNQDLPEISGRLRELRHSVRKTISEMYTECIINRDSVHDPGYEISMTNSLDVKDTDLDLLTGNFKRVQEGLRVIEENLKVLGFQDISKKYESFRYVSYDLEKKVYEISSPYIKPEFPDTDIYCLTAEKFSKGRDNITIVKEMIEAGIKIIQYREKEKKPGEKFEECIKIRRMTRDADVIFIINDDIDLALMVGADGVHIGQDDYPINEVRKLVGDDMLIGLSTHSEEQAIDAEEKGADYIGVGPIFKTETKEDVCDPVGFEYLDYVVKNVNIPFVAIGGIKKDNIGEVAARGARCAALVTEIVGADDVKKMITVLKEIMKKHRKQEMM